MSGGCTEVVLSFRSREACHDSFGFCEEAEKWEDRDLKTGHFVHLKPHAVPRSSPAPRIVLLHGMSQSLNVWVPTATKLCEGPLHAECLLIDLIGHGRTPIPGDVSNRCRADVMCRQLHRALNAVGWLDHDSPKIILAGISLGAAICLLWAEKHLDKVERIVRVAGAGLRENILSPLNFLVRSIGGAKIVSLFRRFMHPVLDVPYVVACIQAPEYGVDQNIPEILQVEQIPVSIVAGTTDWVHQAHIDRWKPQELVLKNGWGHAQICTRIDDLNLADRHELWIGATSTKCLFKVGVAERGPRAKL